MAPWSVLQIAGRVRQSNGRSDPKEAEYQFHIWSKSYVFPGDQRIISLADMRRLELNPDVEEHLTAIRGWRRRIVAERGAVHYSVRILKIVVVP